METKMEGNRSLTLALILSVFIAGSALAEGNCSQSSSGTQNGKPRTSDSSQNTSSPNSSSSNSGVSDDDDIDADDTDDDSVLDDVNDIIDATDDTISDIDDALDSTATEEEYDEAVSESSDELDELEDMVAEVSQNSEISAALRRGLRTSDVSRASDLVRVAAAEDVSSFASAARKAAFRASLTPQTTPGKLRLAQRSALKVAIRRLVTVGKMAKKIKQQLEQTN